MVKQCFELCMTSNESHIHSTDPPCLRLHWFNSFGFIRLWFREIQSPFGVFLLEELQREFTLLDGAPKRRHNIFTLQAWHLFLVPRGRLFLQRCNSAPHWKDMEMELNFSGRHQEFNVTEGNYAPSQYSVAMEG